MAHGTTEVFETVNSDRRLRAFKPLTGSERIVLEASHEPGGMPITVPIELHRADAIAFARFILASFATP